MLVKNKLIINDNKKISKSDLEEYIKQKPNRKIFGYYRFHLALYNAVSQEKVDKKTELKKEKLIEKNNRIDVKNQKRTEKGKSLKVHKEYKPHWREKWKTIVGEKPSVYDSTATVSSSKQMKLFLFKSGYYDAIDTSYTKKPFLSKKKIKIIYKLTPKDPYIIQSYQYVLPDVQIETLVDFLIVGKKIGNKEGTIIDIDKLDKEREIISTELNNSGFYNFNKEYFSFQIDTNQVKHTADVKLILNSPKSRDLFQDSVKIEEHKQYTVESVKINVIGGGINSNDELLLTMNNIDFFYNNSKETVKASEISRHILFKNQQLYNLSKVTQTRKRLVSMGLFENVHITFEETESDGFYGALKCVINLKLLKKQTLEAETNGTHTNGSYGIGGSLSYSNRNSFRGAERFKFSISGGILTQRSLTSEEELNLEPSDRIINTFEIGPKLEYTLPRLLFIKKQFSNIDYTQTAIHANMNWQITPDYNRQIQEVSFGYNWRKENHTFSINPIEISFVNIDITNLDFKTRIENLSDPFLRNSFQSHVNTGSRLKHNFVKYKPKTAYFVSTSLEGAGNSLKYAYNFIGIDENENGNHEFLGIEFAQFVKLQSELRIHYNIAKSNDLAFRLNGGIGVPFHNSNFALPFEKSFYIGGPNSLRAFKTRTLGPGSYSSTERTFDKIGDIIIEGNAEYRFELTSTYEGAFFVDAGNIWMYDSNTSRVGGNFVFNKFVNDIAIGAGFGLRLDLTYFLLRFDLALPIKAPYLPDGQQWLFQKQTVEGKNFTPQLNFGIGYPF